MMNSKSAGESRRSRRLALFLTLVLGIALIVGVERGASSVEPGNAWDVQQKYSRPDAEMAAELLRNVSGANAVLCGAVERAFQTGNWGNNASIQPDANADEVTRWIGKDHLDRATLEVARRAFESPDDCTRRVAAHIAGHVELQRMDEELRSELESTDARVRITAVRALGYDGESTSLRRLMSMLNDNDRMVRLTAIWAIGRVGDEASSETLVRILKNDTDADARRLAAYALGQIHG